MSIARCASIGVIGVCGFASLASACPSCAESIDESAVAADASDPVSLGRGFNGAIYLLLGGAMIGAGLVSGTLFLGGIRSEARP